mgnify:CR=1 FL=1
MNIKTDFGTIGIKIGDIITFEPLKKEFKVGSGDGVPGNGGTMIYWREEGNHELASLRYATRYLMKEAFQEDADIFALWTYNGQTLRDIHKRNMHDNPQK